MKFLKLVSTRHRCLAAFLDASIQPSLISRTGSTSRLWHLSSLSAQVGIVVHIRTQSSTSLYIYRTPDHLRQSLIDAKEHNFALGVKLVRGAYHPHELIAYHASAAGRPSPSISPDAEPPVWTSKAETDKCYNECAKLLINTIHNDISASAWSWIRRSRPQSIGVLFGTHNWESCNLILNELAQRGLASVSAIADEDKVFTLSDDVTERLTIGQLFGMSDALTEHLIERTRSRSPLIIK